MNKYFVLVVEYCTVVEWSKTRWILFGTGTTKLQNWNTREDSLWIKVHIKHKCWRNKAYAWLFRNGNHSINVYIHICTPHKMLLHAFFSGVGIFMTIKISVLIHLTFLFKLLRLELHNYEWYQFPVVCSRIMKNMKTGRGGGSIETESEI